ncbi:MAG: protein kinase [Piscinibacter sp.]
MSARPLGLSAAFGDTGAPLPRSLGKYLISRVLGEGAMGVVYEALDPDIHRAVAIKAIRAPLLAPDAHDLSATIRFRTEAQAAGRLAHPNIVAVYEYGEAEGQHYIAMEHVAGTSLQELLSRGERLPLGDALSVMQQLLDALACAHAQGVWHRDIKPANLLLTADGRLKVTDFGIARIESGDRTHHTTVLGSPGYMAPERYTDDAPDRRVDIFSCGVLLYELLAGRVPFRGAAGAVMYQVMHNEPPPPSTLELDPPVPVRFDALVARAIAKRAADRFDDAAQMLDALRAAAGAPIAARVCSATLRRLQPPRHDAVTQLMPRPPAVTPRSVPTAPPVVASSSLPDWDARALLTIEQMLLPQLGPMTRFVVRDAARRVHDLPGLVARLAAEVVEPEERGRFLAQLCQRLPGARPGPTASAATKPPVLGTTPMQPELIERAQRVLAEHVGPIAAVLARRAAARALSREAFYSALADQAGPDVDRKALLTRFWQAR